MAPPPNDSSGERGSWFWTVLAWLLVVSWLMAGALACLLVGGLAALAGDRERHVAHRMLAKAYFTGIRRHPRWEVRVTGSERLQDGPFVLCANHQSYADAVVLFGLPLDFKWVIKKELFRIPLFGACMSLSRYPAIERGDSVSANKVMDACLQHLSAGTSVLVFPEGTRSPTGELGPFSSGAARLAVAAGVPLLPVGVAGTGRLLPKGSGRFARRAYLAVHVGEPVTTIGRSKGGSVQLRRELRQGVQVACEEAERVASRLATEAT